MELTRGIQYGGRFGEGKSPLGSEGGKGGNILFLIYSYIMRKIFVWFLCRDARVVRGDAELPEQGEQAVGEQQGVDVAAMLVFSDRDVVRLDQLIEIVLDGAHG